ncbi:MAG: aminotransferase class V-fold PLP-dependent enzyme, partial [Candidatus Kapaibacterium sp.]
MTVASSTAASSAILSTRRNVLGTPIPASTNGHPDVPGTRGPKDEKYWDSVRDEFPITRELIYFNNGTMGPSPRAVTERVTKRIEYVDRTGEYNGDYEGLRTALARVLNAESGDQIAFTHNVSEAISIVASGIDLKAGDEVLLTNQEHAGNAIPWLARKKRDGIVIKFVSLTDEMSNAYSDDDFIQRVSDAITPRTRAISMPHLTCTTGQLLPIQRLTALAHEKASANGAPIWFLADGAHPPGMLETDVRALGVHAYASCGHKWLCGPKGIGFLYIGPELMQNVIPTWCGGESDKYWGYDARLDFLPTASRYDFATQNFALFDGLHAAIDFMQNIGLANIEARVKYLTGTLRDGLRPFAEGRFRFLTPDTSVTGLTTIKLDKMNYQDFANTLLAKHKVRTRVVPEGALDAN